MVTDGGARGLNMRLCSLSGEKGIAPVAASGECYAPTSLANEFDGHRQRERAPRTIGCKYGRCSIKRQRQARAISK